MYIIIPRATIKNILRKHRKNITNEIKWNTKIKQKEKKQMKAEKGTKE